MPNPKFSPQKLQALMNEKGLNPYAVDGACGFIDKHGACDGRTRKMLNGRQPKANTLFDLAEGLGVPMEYFFENTSEKT